MISSEEKQDTKDDLAKGIAYFWRSSNLEPRIRSFALRDGIAEVALGNNHTLLLTFNSRLLSVGENTFGQLGLGDFKARREPTVVEFFRDKRVIAIACGGHHSGVICKNHEVFFWGDSSSGQCGVGEVKSLNQPCKVEFQRNDTLRAQEESLSPEQGELTRKKTVIKQISCGDSHSLALSAAGEVWSWGAGCQLGQGVEKEKVALPQRIDFLSGRNVTSIVCGAYHSLAIVQESKSYPSFVVCKGDNVNSTPAGPKPKQEIGKRKFRRRSKEARRKSQTSTKHETQSGKDNKKDVTIQLDSEKSTSARTYLSYEPVLSGESTANGNDAGKDGHKTSEQDEKEDSEALRETQKFDSLDYVDCSAELSQSSFDQTINSKDNPSLVICDSHFGNAGEAIADKFFNVSLDQSKSVLNLTEPSGNILYSSASPLFPSSPTSSGSLSYLSDSDSEQDSVIKSGFERKDDAMSLVGRISSGFYNGLSGRLIRSDVNLSKITNAVVGSVAGMFVGSMPGQLNLRDSSGSLTSLKPCEHCRLVGLCLCDLSSGKFGLSGANTQVWSWGRGGCGQLGLGDTEDRFLPCCVETLNDAGVVKLAAGTFHSLAQTSCSQVYSWGDNSCGQLGRKKSMAIEPKKVRCFSDVLIWDIAAGSHYSLFIGDMAPSKTDVYVCGRQPSAMPSIAATMNSIRDSRSLPSIPSDDSSVMMSTPKERPVLSTSQSFGDTKERSLQHSRVEIVRLTMFRTVGQLRSVAATTEHCVCIAASDKRGKLEVVSELASKERLFYYQLALIWQAVLVPLLQSEVWICLSLQQMGHVLAPIIKNFYEVMKCVSTNQSGATELVSSMTSFHKLFNLCWSDEFLQTFERYSESFSNGVAYGVFTAFSNVSSDISSQCQAVLCDVLDDSAQGFVSSDNAFQFVMQFPLLKMQHYRLIVGKLHNTLQMTENSAEDCARLHEEARRWEQFITLDENRQTQAEVTQKFWQDCPAKILEAFKDCHRRLLRSSNVHSLFPLKGNRFSSPLFVLFDDFFLHFQSAKNVQVFPLATVWAEGVDDSQGVMNGIKITTPEEILLVCAPSAVDKADWLLTINQAVANIISKTTTYSLGADSLNPKTGSLMPAAAREATYTYEHDSLYLGACYHGMWLRGKPHGHGEMHWPDGRHYTGEFRNGLHHGEGMLIFPPNVAEHSEEKYEGHWNCGKMAGFGRMRFCNGDIYEGYWQKSKRCGHGCMKSGTMYSSGATMYIGEWFDDKRSGYGVLDDILRGEKYMGMWEADSRHGPGLVVTLDGIYNQGTFSQNKLTGNGVLLCDDNTKYQGEFFGDCLLSGKGTLTLPNGDFIEGTFAGLWGEGIRVNGTFHKLEMTSSATRSDQTGSKCLIPPEKKWTSLFLNCRQSLCCRGDLNAQHTIVWKALSVCLITGRDTKLSHNDQEVTKELLRINRDMEQKSLGCTDLQTIQGYLSKAFDSKQHPLGQLVNGLVDVFRASYVGMGTHRRLLPHAVAEVKSFVTRVYNIVRLLFPALPNEEYLHVATDTVSGIASHSTEESWTSSMLLHPLLFPRLYPPLFTLYALDNDRADSAYWEQIQLLNKRSDWALMTYVGMQRHFWLTNEQDVGSRSDEVKLENREPEHYTSAVECLQQISTKFSPMEKLEVLKTTFEKINEEVTCFWQGEKKLVSLDDLFPVFQFVVIRARIPHLGSEIHFIDDMVDSHVHIGEQGHMFTTLKASFFQIQNEKG
ncbi:alsin-like isoform X2 [Montipora foliosa]|uniref:alsin-like isoform X2 n=1 Tax=Montipora foliosa TaxID=591990 RepID=UPI0035F1239D